MKEESDLQKYIHISKYARYITKSNKREDWPSTVTRWVDFWKNYTDITEKLNKTDLKKIENHILYLQVMPSMRGLMTAGKALSRDNIAGYNCAFININHPRCFDEIFYLCLCASGVGFSVERKHVVKLPVVSEDFYNTDTTIVIRDSKIGWAVGLKELISMLYQGGIPEINVDKVRPAGARLKTFGGRASGPAPLLELFNHVINIFKKAAGRQLQSIECHDLICHIMSAVLVGGVRRCLPDFYEVKMADNSYKCIKDVVVGDEIEFMKENYKVLNTYNNGRQEMIKINTTNGYHLSTANHKWLVFDKKENISLWVTAGDIEAQPTRYMFISEDV